MTRLPRVTSWPRLIVTVCLLWSLAEMAIAHFGGRPITELREMLWAILFAVMLVLLNVVGRDVP